MVKIGTQFAISSSVYNGTLICRGSPPIFCARNVTSISTSTLATTETPAVEIKPCCFHRSQTPQCLKTRNSYHAPSFGEGGVGEGYVIFNLNA